jgi:hypothetical protein
MHDVVTESQDTTELCDVYLVGSELCGVCCVLWCVGSGFQVQGLGSGNLDPMRATVPINFVETCRKAVVECLKMAMSSSAALVIYIKFRAS